MEEKNSNVLNYVGIGIIALLLLGLIFTISSNIKNKKSLKAEKLTSEQLLSEKQMVEKDLANLKAEYSALEEKSIATDQMLQESNQQIVENQKKINSLYRQNRSLRSYKDKYAELEKEKADLEQKQSQLTSDYEKLLAKSKDLQNSLTSLEAEKDDLTLQLEKAKMYDTDNFLATATRGKKKERVVICARRAKKLNMMFDVPKELTEEVSFKITTPSGEIINPDDKALTWIFVQDARSFTASLSAVAGKFEESKQVVLTYAATKKLVGGEYKIQIISNGNNIGNCRIKLK